MVSASRTQKTNDKVTACNTDVLAKPILEWTTAEVDRIYRTVIQSAEPTDLRVAWLANHTIEPTVRAVTAFSIACDVRLDNFIAPYDQHFQEVLSENSGTLSHKPDLIVLWLSLRGLAPVLAEGSVSLGTSEVWHEIERIKETFSNWVNLAKDRSSAHIFLCNFPRSPELRFGIADLSSSTGEQFLFGELNRWLSEAHAEDPQVTIVDTSHAVNRAGCRQSWNPRMYRLAKIEWDAPATQDIADLFTRYCRALVRPARKCIVVDLDNTLWGGVLGEDGIDGVRVGEGDPTGESFAAFQRALLDLKARGILLAVCSKNNPADVEELFRVRSEMPLCLEDFAAQRINWESKNINIEAIAAELNIGTDSLVFIDDDPAECELIRQMLPEVKTVHLPPDPAGYADLLYSMYEFDKIRLTSEDKQRTQQYIDNHARESKKQAATDMKSFLESLGTEVVIKAATSENLTRVHQLISKTNQFNVTTIRYTAAQVQKIFEADDCVLDIIRVADNFGDLGIVGTYVVQFVGDHAVIDSFVLSCRALGRGIESAICNHVKRKIFTSDSVSYIQARFIPSAKNKPASGFYVEQGFQLMATDEDGTESYRLDRAECGEIECPGVSVTVEDA